MYSGRRLEALAAMAEADESPLERDIARAKLEAAGQWPPPPRPPARAAAPAPEPRFSRAWTVTTSSAAGSATGTVWVRFDVSG